MGQELGCESTIKKLKIRMRDKPNLLVSRLVMQQYIDDCGPQYQDLSSFAIYCAKLF